MNRRLLLLAALAVSACATMGPPVLVARPGLVRAELEPVEVIGVDRDAITIRVDSNGCARKAHFTFYLDRRSGTPSLSFARHTLTSCRAPAAFHEDMAFSWTELGLRPGERFVLLNPLLSRTGARL